MINLGNLADSDLGLAIIGRAAVRIKSVSKRTSQKGSSGLDVTYVVEDHEDAKNVGKSFKGETMWFPHSGQKDGGKFCQKTLIKFGLAFGGEFTEDGLDEESLIGNIGDVELKAYTEKDQETGEYVEDPERTVIRKFYYDANAYKALVNGEETESDSSY